MSGLDNHPINGKDFQPDPKSPMLTELSEESDEELYRGPFFERLMDNSGWMKVNSFRACKHCRQSHIKCSIATTGGPCYHCRRRNGWCELPERCDKREVTGWRFHPGASPLMIYKLVEPVSCRIPGTPPESIDERAFRYKPLHAHELIKRLEWLRQAPSRFRKRSGPMSWTGADDPDSKRSKTSKEAEVDGGGELKKRFAEQASKCSSSKASESRFCGFPSNRVLDSPATGFEVAGVLQSWEASSVSNSRSPTGVDPDPCPTDSQRHLGKKKSRVSPVPLKARRGKADMKMRVSFPNPPDPNLEPDHLILAGSGRENFRKKIEFGDLSHQTHLDKSPLTPESPSEVQIRPEDGLPGCRVISSASTPDRMSIPFILSPCTSDATHAFSNKLKLEFSSQCDDWAARCNTTENCYRSNTSSTSNTRSPSLEPLGEEEEEGLLHSSSPSILHRPHHHDSKFQVTHPNDNVKGTDTTNATWDSLPSRLASSSHIIPKGLSPNRKLITGLGSVVNVGSIGNIDGVSVGRPCQLPSLKQLFSSVECFLPPLRNL